MQRSHLTKVGWAYGLPDAALAAALLESHGIKVFAQSFQTKAVHWHLTHALGGVALCVSASQRDDALQILAGFEGTKPRGNRLLRLLFAAVVFALAGFPPPPTGFVAAGPRLATARAAMPVGDLA